MYLIEAARSLYSTKQRTILALIGIVIGIGSVIALVSIGKIVSAEAAKEFRSLGTDVITIKARSDKAADLRNPRLFRKLPQVTPCVSVIAPYVTIYTNISIDNEDDDDLTLLGVDEGFQAFTRFELAAGRFISSLDANRPYVVLGAGVAETLGLPSDPNKLIDTEIEVDQRRLRVVGVLKAYMPLRSIDVKTNYSVFIPIQYVLDSESNRSINTMVLRSQPSADTGQCAKKIESYFKRRIKNISINISTAEQLIAQMRKQADMLSVLLTAIGSISLVVGGVGIMNIMLVSVSERKQEIGIRRALGAKRKDVRYQFLTESLLLSLLGGLIGVLASIATTYYVAQFNGWTFFISWQAVFLGAGISAAIGVFFGFIPAHQAAKLDPIQALRGE